MPDRPPPTPAGTPPDVPVAATDDPYAERFDLEGRSLREHTARGTIINSLFNIGLAALEFIRRLLIVSFLTAAEFGFWGILVVSLATIVWLKQVGVGDKYIQQADDDQEVAFQKAFTLELFYTLAFYVLIVLALPLYAFLYGRPEIILPGFILSLAVLGSGFTSPLWIFYRRMQFVRQRVLQGVNPVVSFVVTVPLVVAGLGYWGLVVGAVAGSFAAAAVALVACPYPIRLRFDRGTLREYVSFSWPLLIVSGSNLVIVQVAVLVGDVTVGLAGVGVIGLVGIIIRFSDQVNNIVTQTMYPAVCAVRDRTELLFETFVKSNRLALMWSVPFGIGLTLFAPDLVEYGLGDKWQAAVVPLQAFGLIAAANQIGFNWTAFMRALNRTRPMAVNGVLAMVTFLVAGVPMMFVAGITGYVVGFGAAIAVQIVCRLYYLKRLFTGFGITRHIMRAFAPVVPAIALVLAARLLEGGTERTLGLALVEIALYSAATLAVTVLLERRLLREIMAYLRRSGPRSLAPSAG